MSNEQEYADEIWRPAPGYEAQYECSNYGRVRSIPRTVRRNRNDIDLAGQILSPSKGANGNLQLRLSKEGHSQLITVARLVLRTWFREPGAGEVVGYLDYNPENVHGDNLAWMSRSEHYQHLQDKEVCT